MASLFRKTSRNAFRSLLLVSAVFVAGCVQVPDLGPLPARKPVEILTAEESFRAPVAEWPSDRWWTGYGDAQLALLIDEALADSPDLAQAQARLRKAEGAAQQVGAALLPQVQAKGSATEFTLNSDRRIAGLNPNGGNDLSRGSLNFDYEIDFWGKNHALLAAATSTAEAARADAAAARLALSTAIASSYADLAQLYGDRDAGVDALRVRSDTASLLEERQSQGLENQGAVKSADAARAAAEAQLASVNESIALTKNRIAALMGAGPDRGLSIARPALSIKAFGLPRNVQADLLGRRPDVAAARLRAEAAARGIDAAKADFYPNVNLSAALGINTFALNSLGRSTSEYAAFGPAVSLPIFSGGRIEGAYREARAEYDASVAVYNSTLDQALRDVADAATSSRALGERLATSRDALMASEDAYRIVQNRYLGGLATYLEVLSAEDSLIANRRAVTDLETRAFALDVALIRALGGGYQS